MEDVKKIIDRANKYFKRAKLLEYFEWIAIVIGWAIFAIAVCVYTGKSDPKAILLGFGSLAAFVVVMVLLIVKFTLVKHAKKEGEELKHNCVRLKLVSQGYFDFCSFFISPNKVTFLQGPKTDDEKTMIIFIWENGEIESRDMRKEEIAAMFEPMFKE